MGLYDLYRLGLFLELGISFKTTNCIGSLKVRYWKNSDHKHRWLAGALLGIEPRLRKVKGYRYFRQLRTAIRNKIGRQREKQEIQAAGIAW